MKEVSDFIEWKNAKNKSSLEENLKAETNALGWIKTDTMYSFLGIYAIGLKAFYPERFSCSGNIIYTKEKTRAYSKRYITKHYMEFTKLNELPDLKIFLNLYLTLGNVIPMWPGGNVNRGMGHCYDLPEVYFNRNQEWAKILSKTYENACLDTIIENKHDINLPDLLRLNEDGYIKFLQYIVENIQSRNNYFKESNV